MSTGQRNRFIHQFFEGRKWQNGESESNIEIGEEKKE